MYRSTEYRDLKIDVDAALLDECDGRSTFMDSGRSFGAGLEAANSFQCLLRELDSNRVLGADSTVGRELVVRKIVSYFFDTRMFYFELKDKGQQTLGDAFIYGIYVGNSLILKESF